MNFAVIFVFYLLGAPLTSSLPDQKPDLLIIGNDTIFLKSFPLEQLGFAKRPFSYGNYDFPNEYCFRGYQAVWKVVDKKLLLSEIIKADGSAEKADMIAYFMQNNYTPVVYGGSIFADWFTMDLTSFPREYKFLGCVWKGKRAKKLKPALRFKNGILVVNRCK